MTVTGELRVGVIGVGDMGSAVVTSLLRAGIDVTVFDTRAEQMSLMAEIGAQPADDLMDLVEQSNVVSLVVVTDEQVKAVGKEVLGRAQPGTIVLVHSTVRPQTVAQLAEEGRARDVQVLDVAVNGGAEKASVGALTLMIGGDAETIEEIDAYLGAIGDHVFHLGPTGSGLVGKLVNNLIAIGSYALQLEAMDLAAAYGIDEDSVASAVIASQGDSRGMRMWGRHDRKRAARAAVGVDWSDRMGRDLHEAVAAGDAHGAELPLTAITADMLPEKLRQRDRQLALRGPLPSIPLCAACQSELALPFREAGTHPECRNR